MKECVPSEDQLLKAWRLYVRSKLNPWRRNVLGWAGYQRETIDRGFYKRMDALKKFSEIDALTVPQDVWEHRPAIEVPEFITEVLKFWETDYSTHSRDCYKWHAGCLARIVKQWIEEGAE